VEKHFSSKTIIGEPIKIDDAIIFPMVDVSFGIAAGSFVQERKNNEAGGVGAKMSPSAVLVIQNGTSRIINIKDRDALNKIIDLVPELVDKVYDWMNRREGEQK
jgi:uncharacterized spore protein YtfJ